MELRGNASACEDSPAQRDRLVAAACRLYPELAAVDIVEERWVTSVIEPGFRPGSHACRPRVSTPYGSLVLAGDFARLGFPAAAMERCVASGMLAANHLLDRWDVKGEALHSVAPRGFMRML